MIKVGDFIRVANWGCLIPVCREWFEERKNELDFMWVIRYAYGDHGKFFSRRFTDETKYVVLYIDSVFERALITHSIQNNKVYLIKLDGIELYDKPTEMTISEIEEKLGVKNLRIIKEDK